MVCCPTYSINQADYVASIWRMDQSGFQIFVSSFLLCRWINHNRCCSQIVVRISCCYRPCFRIWRKEMAVMWLKDDTTFATGNFARLRTYTYAAIRENLTRVKKISNNYIPIKLQSEQSFYQNQLLCFRNQDRFRSLKVNIISCKTVNSLTSSRW